MPGFGFTSKRDREYKELMKQRMEQLDRDMNKHVVPLSAMDARKLTSLGDAYSAEAYELAHKFLPHKMETASQSMGKMAKLSTEWEPKSDVWFHTYGAYLLCGLTVASSTYIVAHFRQHLRLERYARMVMYSVGAGFPFIAAGTYNQYWSNLYIARKGERCHTCIAVKNAVFQSGMTVLYPSLLTCLMGFFYAQSYHTIPSVPANFLSSKEQAAHVWRLVQAIAERSHFSKIMMLLFLVNLFAGYYVSEKQQEECVLMFKKILDQQEMIVQANRGVAVVDSYTDSFH